MVLTNCGWMVGGDGRDAKRRVRSDEEMKPVIG